MAGYVLIPLCCHHWKRSSKHTVLDDTQYIDILHTIKKYIHTDDTIIQNFQHVHTYYYITYLDIKTEVEKEQITFREPVIGKTIKFFNCLRYIHKSWDFSPKYRQVYHLVLNK